MEDTLSRGGTNKCSQNPLEKHWPGREIGGMKENVLVRYKEELVKTGVGNQDSPWTTWKLMG
jgi:hypothetical protein